MAAVGHQLVDDRPVDDALTGPHALHGVDQLLDAAHPLLEEVADTLGALLDESQRVFGLEVLDASLVIESEPGAGTTVSVEIPCG